MLHFLSLVFYYLKSLEISYDNYLSFPSESDCKISLGRYMDHIYDLKCSPPDSDHSAKTSFQSRTPLSICLFLRDLEKDIKIPKSYNLPREKIKCSFQYL